MLITDKDWVSTINPDKNHIFLLEHLEPAMTVEQLDRIVTKHNNGIDYKLISKQERRHPVEVIIALLHQATTPSRWNRGKVEVKRPFARLIK